MDKNQHRFAQRNAAIVAARAAGRTLEDIGREFGLSKVRVRQITLAAERSDRRRKELEAERSLWAGPISDMPIRLLLCDLSVRTGSVLLSMNYETIGQIGSDQELLYNPNFGRKSLVELRTAIKALAESINYSPPSAAPRA